MYFNNKFLNNLCPFSSTLNLSTEKSCYSKSQHNYCRHPIKTALPSNKTLTLQLAPRPFTIYTTTFSPSHHHHFTGRTFTRLTIIFISANRMLKNGWLATNQKLDAT